MERKRTKRKLYYALFLFGIGLLVYFAMRPASIAVEIGRAEIGPMSVTVDEQGKMRAHDRFVVSAPISGRLRRIELHEGDSVVEGETVALISPLPLSEREQLEVTSRVEAARAYQKEASQQVKQLQAAYEQSKSDLQRMQKLAKDGLIPPQQLEQAQNKEEIAQKELEAAKFKERGFASELAAVQAALIALEPGSNHLVRLTSPVTGKVLRIPEKSERIVQPGTELIIVGDPKNLEMVVDVLSVDAVNIKPGQAVWIGEWGGEKKLHARVRVVEPYAFTKVSALGIEEQRVNIIADILDGVQSLGDGYRVQSHIVIWSAPSVLKVPVSALFRYGSQWGVFVVKSGRASLKTVDAGHRNALEAEIRKGLIPGEIVILHPSNQLEDGARVEIAR